MRRQIMRELKHPDNAISIATIDNEGRMECWWVYVLGDTIHFMGLNERWLRILQRGTDVEEVIRKEICER